MTRRREPFEGLTGQPPQNAPAGPVGRGRSVPPPTPRHPSIPPRSRWPGQPRWSRQSPPSCDHATPAGQADASTNPSRDAPCQTCSPDGPTFRVRAIRIHRSCGKHTRSSPTGGPLALTCHIRARAMRTATPTQDLPAGQIARACRNDGAPVRPGVPTTSPGWRRWHVASGVPGRLWPRDQAGVQAPSGTSERSMVTRRQGFARCDRERSASL